MSNCCEVCQSKVNISCNHFGAKTCKACAAFFRRTISMKLDYTCIEEEDACQVHHQSRIICRFCRLKKCEAVGMKPILVKSKNERKRYIRISKGLVRKRSPLGREERKVSTKFHPNFEEDSVNLADELNPQPSSASPYFMEIQETTSTFIKLETSMCDRRRLLYAETPISIVLEGAREWPYDSSRLKMFDYKASQGMTKHDFVMIMDYARGMPGFDKLNYADSVFCYRLVCAVDFVINSSFYTYKRGAEHNELVLNDGTFVPMNPTPLTGYEDNANLLFQNQDDLMKFRTLMPLLLNQWKVASELAKLELSFDEFCLLKAICIWHVSYYRLSEDGRKVVSEQRDRLIRALHHVCEMRNSEDVNDDDDVFENSEFGEERFGNVMMALNYIMEQIRNVNCSFVMISIFGILNVDSLMIDVTSFW